MPSPSQPTRARSRTAWIALVAVLLGVGLIAAIATPFLNSATSPASPSPTIALISSTRTPDEASSNTSQHSPLAATSPTQLSPTRTLVTPSETPAQLPPPTETALLLILTPGSTPTVAPLSNTPTATPIAFVEARVERIIDGDTLEVLLEGQAVRLRLIGVDAPETNGPPICFGLEATMKAEELIGRTAGRVLLEKDVSETDRYGRLLRYVWLEHPDGRRMLNEELVKEGFAQVSTYPPDVKYQAQFLAAERDAREGKRGLWGACGGFGVLLPTPTSLPAPIASPPIPPSSQPTAVTNPAPGSLPYDPNGPDRDCPDFATQQEAQQFFLAAGGPDRDPHRLDGDHDGIACETLP
ncbi:MAG TPA: thermonuclease family protein [Chloroflexia bacterium]|nr:thermonuclease family protein [Chloroflexia bacterium]